MNNGELELNDVIAICSRAKLADHSMTFDSFGTDEPRIDTLEFLVRIGKEWEDAEAIVNSLTAADYVAGPVTHYDSNRKERKLWIFKKSAFGLRIYIKVLPYNKNRYIAVISFHEDR